MKLYLNVLKVFLLLACAIGVVFVTRGCGVGRKPEVSVVSQRSDATKYDILVENWNRAVINAKLSRYYYLPDTDSEGVIAKLNAIIVPFYKCSDLAFKKELTTITIDNNYTFFSFYRDFLNNHYISTKITFNIGQTSSEIRKKICQVTKSDRINTQTLITLSSMSDPCYYFQNYRDDLYKKGLSRNVKSCNDMQINKEKFPLLFSMTNK